MIKRFGGFLLGMVIMLFILGRYSDKNNPSKSLVAYITEDGILQAIIYVVLIVLASILIGVEGKSKKDYSKFFYNVLVKLFGDPKWKKL